MKFNVVMFIKQMYVAITKVIQQKIISKKTRKQKISDEIDKLLHESVFRELTKEEHKKYNELKKRL